MSYNANVPQEKFPKLNSWRDESNHRLRMQNDYIPNSLLPKSISQSQIENPVKFMKILSFCRKNGWVMQNHGLRIHIDKICAYSTTYQKYPKIPHNLFWWSAQSAKIFEKKFSLGVRSLCDYQLWIEFDCLILNLQLVDGRVGKWSDLSSCSWENFQTLKIGG